MRIIKILTILAFMMTFCAGESGAIKPMTPPHILVVPDLIYCKEHGFTTTYDNHGITEVIPDYERAVTEDKTLHSALTQIESLINERDPKIVIVDLIESINNAKKDMAMSAAAGGSDAESIEEAIIRNSAADIIVKVSYDLLRRGPNYSVSYTIVGTDSYTAGKIVPIEGVGAESSSANPAILLREAIYDRMDDFLYRLQRHYQTVAENGRMVAFEIKTTNTSPHTMNSVIGAETLREAIDNFLYDNSVDGGGLERVRGGDTFLQYDGVYIPLTGMISGRARRQGAKDVAQRLTNHLAAIGVTADFKIIGLGKVNIYIR